MPIINNLPYGGGGNESFPSDFVPILIMNYQLNASCCTFAIYKGNSSPYMGMPNSSDTSSISNTRASYFYPLKDITARFRYVTSTTNQDLTLKKNTLYRIQKCRFTRSGSTYYKVYLQEYDGSNYIDIVTTFESTSDKWNNYILDNITW